MLAQNVGRMGVRGSTALGWQLQPFGCPWVGGIWPCSRGWEDAEPPPALSWHVGLLSFVLGGPGSQACFWDVWVLISSSTSPVFGEQRCLGTIEFEGHEMVSKSTGNGGDHYTQPRLVGSSFLLDTAMLSP